LTLNRAGTHYVSTWSILWPLKQLGYARTENKARKVLAEYHAAEHLVA
jgi:hypothetical protein